VAEFEEAEPTEAQIDEFHAWRARRLLIVVPLLMCVGVIAIVLAVTVLHSDLLGNVGLAGVWFGLVLSLVWLFQRSARVRRERNR
jgi:heme A synthase